MSLPSNAEQAYWIKAPALWFSGDASYRKNPKSAFRFWTSSTAFLPLGFWNGINRYKTMRWVNSLSKCPAEEKKSEKWRSLKTRCKRNLQQRAPGVSCSQSLEKGVWEAEKGRLTRSRTARFGKRRWHLNYLKNEEESLGKDREIRVGHKHEIFELTGADGNRRVCCTKI